MSKFINTKHKVSMDALIDGFKDKMNNPYYLHMDKKPNPVTYFNQNLHKSTLDEGSKLQYSPLGSDSPTKYNKIYGLYIYGLEKIIASLENGEWGLESSSIEGEAIILPNTIIPTPNDYFTIDHIKNKKLLFKVTSVTMDTIENDANFYKIEYKLDQITDEVINTQVAEEYTMIVNNIGTKFNTIVRNNDYEFIDRVESVLDRLREYYSNIFYSSRVQTFVFVDDYTHFYDSYMVEFLKRNDILNGTSSYIFVAHQSYVQATFSLDYDKTFFRYVEMPEKLVPPLVHSQAKIIDEPLSIFSSRIEQYYKLEYNIRIVDPNRPMLNNFSVDIMDRIKSSTMYEKNEDRYKNIIIKYFNKLEITSDDIDALEYIDYQQNIELFYNIPIVIYIIENKVRKLLR